MGQLIKKVGYTSAALFGVLSLGLMLLSFPSGKLLAQSVQTGSMVPAIKPGTMVFSRKVAFSDLKIGDVIAYSALTGPTHTVTHRIVGFSSSMAGREVIVKGDANKSADAPVMSYQVLGKAEFIVPKLGYVTDFMHRPIGLILLLYVPALLIIISELRLFITQLLALERKTARHVNNRDDPWLSHELPFVHPRLGSSLDNASSRRQGLVRLDQRLHIKPTAAVFTLFVTLALLTALSAPTFSSLTAQASLKSSTISTGKLKKPPLPSTCSDDTHVEFNKSSNQTASSGDATNTNNSSTGSATSGGASNNDSSNVTVHITGC